MQTQKAAQKQVDLDKLYEPHRAFKKSPLYMPDCTNIVFGEGNPDAKILFIGEAPGKNEDIQGRPFVGRSGKLLDRALKLAGISREEVFITNIVKCRPPNNRTPLKKELKTGKELLLTQQINIIQPVVICTLGSAALEGLMENSYRITKVRGTALDYHGTTLMPIFHPAYILRCQSKENVFLEDISRAIGLSKK